MCVVVVCAGPRPWVRCAPSTPWLAGLTLVVSHGLDQLEAEFAAEEGGGAVQGFDRDGAFRMRSS